MLLVGTKKGALIYQIDEARKDWKTDGLLLRGWSVLDMAYDGESVLAAASSDVWGATITCSIDLGANWTNRAEGLHFEPNSGRTLEKVWTVELGHPSIHGTVYVGVEPAALFKSEDSGGSWREVSSINEHPTKSEWQPGGGGLCLHTILIDPDNAPRIYVGVSAGGAYRTHDDGHSSFHANVCFDSPASHCLKAASVSGDFTGFSASAAW